MKCFEEHVWLVTELLSFKFWISRHFVTIFTNKGKPQNGLSPQAIQIFHKLFFTLVFVLPRSFIENHPFFTYQLKVKCCCQSCDVILPPKTLQFKLLKRRKPKESRFYNPAKSQLKPMKTVRAVYPYPWRVRFFGLFVCFFNHLAYYF